MKAMMAILGAGATAGTALAGVSVSGYDDLSEGFLGTGFTYQGISYSECNDVGGSFPDGSTFTAADVGDNFIIERATLLYNDFPAWGSADNSLTFGTAYINGDNLSLGAFVRATMDLPQVADSMSMQMAFYENGPWGGIVFHMDAYRNGGLVGSDSFSIADGGGRDNIAFDELAVSGVEFDSVKIYATFNGDYSAPRLFVDDLTVNYVPAPASIAGLAVVGGAMLRRRR